MNDRAAAEGARPALLVAPYLLALIAGGLLLPFHGMAGESLWLDELWSVAASDPALSWRAWMEEWVLPDVHPPLHLLLLRGWRSLLGSDALTLRLLSWLAIVALVAGVLLVHRWLPVTRQPLALAAWIACSTGVVIYAQDARPYAQLLLGSGLATLLASGVAGRMQRGERVGGPLAALAAAVAFAQFSHFFGVLTGVGLFGVLFAQAALRHRRYLPAVVLAGGLSLGPMLAWLALHVPRMADKLGGNFWVTNHWYLDFTRLTAFIVGHPVYFLLLAIAVTAILLRRPRLLAEPGCFVPLGAIPIMAAAAMLISLHTPVITDRNLLILLPPFLLLVVTAVSGFLDASAEPTMGGRGGSGRSGPVLLLLVAATLLLTGYRVTSLEKDQWREAAAQVVAVEGCSEAEIQVYYWPREVYAHYLPAAYAERLRRVSLVEYDPVDLPRARLPEGACPILLWSGHLVGEWVVDWLLDGLALSRDDVEVWRSKGNMIVLHRDRLDRVAE